jgi:hypothetical protein
MKTEIVVVVIGILIAFAKSARVEQEARLLERAHAAEAARAGFEDAARDQLRKADDQRREK